MSLKDQWYQARVQRQNSVKQMHQTAILAKQQRQADNAVRHKGVTQLLNDFKQEDIQRQNQVQEIHQVALADLSLIHI